MKKRILVLSLCMAAVFGGCGTQKESVSDQADFAQPEAVQTEIIQAEGALPEAEQTKIIQAEGALPEGALPEAIQTETERQESFDMESYKDFIRDFKDSVDNIAVCYMIMALYECKYGDVIYSYFEETKIPDVEELVELAYDYVEKEKGITKERLEQRYEDACNVYEEITQMEVLSGEAEEIKSEAIEYFLIIDKLRETVINPSGNFMDLVQCLGKCQDDFMTQRTTLETCLDGKPAQPEAIQIDTEEQESFDMESYKDLIRDFKDSVDYSVTYYALMAWYELDYGQFRYTIPGETEIPDVEKFVELAYDYVEEKEGITKERLEQMYEEACTTYEEISQMEVLGEEAEEIKSEAIEFFLFFDKLRDAIINPDRDFAEFFKQSGNCREDFMTQRSILDTYLD